MADPVLAALYRRPAGSRVPQRQTAPFVFASPHSGRLYPRRLRGREPAERDRACAARKTRSSTCCSPTAVELGAPMIAAEFPRAYLDANRGPAELDPAMFAAPCPFRSTRQAPRGRGAWRHSADRARRGGNLSRAAPPGEAEAERRLGLTGPITRTAAGLVEETRARFGVAVVIDCHSMPSAAAVPDIVLGDRYGMSAAPAWCARPNAPSGAGLHAWRAMCLMPAATPPSCMAGRRAGAMRSRSKSTARFIWTKNASRRARASARCARDTERPCAN